MPRLLSLPPAKPMTPAEIKQATARHRFPGGTPTRRFEIGDEVEIGNLADAVVSEVLSDGLFYVVEYTEASERPQKGRARSVWRWDVVFPKPDGSIRMYSDDDDLRVRPGPMSIGSLLGYLYSSGIDFAPAYQRPFEWTLADKQALIESIFDRCMIGLMAFNKLPFDESRPLREIIDGKQRLNAIREYTEGRFPVRGVYWPQVHPLDRSAFEDTQVPLLELENASERDVLRLFLRVNRTGRRVSEDHIRFVRARLAEIEKGK